jgi:hypothetical protein
MKIKVLLKALAVLTLWIVGSNLRNALGVAMSNKAEKFRKTAAVCRETAKTSKTPLEWSRFAEEWDRMADQADWIAAWQTNFYNPNLDKRVFFVVPPPTLH